MPGLFQKPQPIDEAIPKEAHSRTGFDGNEYELVFSDEFEVSCCFISLHFLPFVVTFFSFLFLFVTIQRDHNPRILLRRRRLLCFHAPTHTCQLRYLGWNLALPFFACELTSSLGHGYISVNRCCS